MSIPSFTQHPVWDVYSMKFRFSCIIISIRKFYIISGSKTIYQSQCSGADPGFFLGGGALVSCSTSTPINLIFILQNTSCIRNPQVISGRGEGVRTPCTLPLDPPLMLFHLQWSIPHWIVSKIETFFLLDHKSLRFWLWLQLWLRRWWKPSLIQDHPPWLFPNISSQGRIFVGADHSRLCCVSNFRVNVFI